MTAYWGQAATQIATNWVRGVSMSADLRKVVTTAESYIGTPYVLGGSSTSGIDCSGLVKKAYAAVGVDLPHKAQEIRKLGVEVPLDSLRAGDVPYVITGTSTEHVGIYDGNGNVIHATRVFGKAVIEPLSNWKSRGWLDGVRRLI